MKNYPGYKDVLKAKLPVFLVVGFRKCRRLLFKAELLCYKLYVVKAAWRRDVVCIHELTEAHRVLYFEVQAIYYRRFRKLVDFSNPIDYNEKIQWLKLFDQSREYVDLCDKLKVRSYVAKTIGAQFLPEIYWEANSVDNGLLERVDRPCVVKANHDSGTVFLVRDPASLCAVEVARELRLSLAFSYGFFSAEWPYWYIDKRVFAEEFLDPESDSPPVDFKFHCVDGEVKWLQYIFDRGVNTKEVHLNREFERLPWHLDIDFELYQGELVKPANWDEMVAAAEQLSAGFKYLRVDLYNIQGRILFGELTFYPKGGLYPSPDVVNFGKMLNFSLKEVRAIVTPL